VEFHDVLQWLKELPNRPLELIERWQSYLTKSQDICKCKPLLQCWDTHEGRWKKQAKGRIDFNKPPLPFDEEEVVRDWANAVENTNDSDDDEEMNV